MLSCIITQQTDCYGSGTISIWSKRAKATSDDDKNKEQTRVLYIIEGWEGKSLFK